MFPLKLIYAELSVDQIFKGIGFAAPVAERHAQQEAALYLRQMLEICICKPYRCLYHCSSIINTQTMVP
jgi:hypothetical protein